MRRSEVMSSRRRGTTAASLAILLASAAVVRAEPVSEDHAARVVTGWLAADSEPLGAELGAGILSVRAFADDTGRTLYYAVDLDPRGFVITAPDDGLGPIIAFSDAGHFSGRDDSPLKTLLDRDVPGRLGWLAAVPGEAAAASKRRWLELTVLADGVGRLGLPAVDDERVPPLVATRWGQKHIFVGADRRACFNYYTPPFGPNNALNYPCGCAGTAWAQLMRHHRHPSAGIGVHAFHIEVDGVPQQLSTRGGNGAGGAYNWAQMPAVPGDGTTDQQRMAIGALCYDAALVGRMSFASNASSGMISWRDAENYLGFSNVVYAYANFGLATLVERAINPNLDAGLPVILGLDRPGGGHEAVCDGYGFNAGTLYHHLNMGWNGTDDAWYELPDVDAQYVYDAVDACYFNIFPVGSGEIISGRVVDEDGSPMAGVKMNCAAGGDVRRTNTNARGIYAFPRVSANTEYGVTASNAGYQFEARRVQTGQSGYPPADLAPGNRWAINFAGVEFSPPAAPQNVSATDGTRNDSVRVTWSAVAGADKYRVYRTEALWQPWSAIGTNWQGGTTFDDTNTFAGRLYAYCVVASNASGLGDFSDLDIGWRDSQSDDPPAVIRASNGTYSNRVLVQWSATPGAFSYRISRASSSTGAFSLLSTTVGAPTNYSDYSALPAHTYRYTVQSSYNGTFWSKMGISDNGWCGMPCPSNLYVSKAIYADKVRVTWDPVANAEGYRVYRASAPDSIKWLILSGWGTNEYFDDTTGEGGVWYYYRVAAKRDWHESDMSTNDVGWRTGGSPAAPGDVEATDGEYPDRVRVTWAAYMPVTISCRVYRAESPFGVKTPLGDWSVLNWYEDTTCEADTMYCYWVRAMNEDGEMSGYSLSDPGYRDEASDRDGDHMPDWQEDRCGTDADDDASFLGFDEPQAFRPPSGEGLIIRWRSEAARTYSLERATNGALAFDERLLTNAPATPPANVHTDRTAVGSGPYIYRVRLDGFP